MNKEYLNGLTLDSFVAIETADDNKIYEYYDYKLSKFLDVYEICVTRFDNQSFEDYCEQNCINEIEESDYKNAYDHAKKMVKKNGYVYMITYFEREHIPVFIEDLPTLKNVIDVYNENNDYANNIREVKITTVY